jgi:hypothetical protein
MAVNLESIVTNQISGAGSNVAAAIASGNFASNLATNATSGLGSIGVSLSGSGIIGKPGESLMAQAGAKSLTASAFGAITKSFKPLEANVPQNLTAIAAKNSEDQAAAEEAAALPAAQVAALQTMPGTSALTSSLKTAQAAASGMSPQTSALLLSTVNALASGGKNSAISGATAGLLKQGIGITQTLTNGKNLSQGQIGSAISAIGAATGGTSAGARQTASLLTASIGIGQTLSSGKNLSTGQIGTIVGALNSTQGKNALPNSLITQSIGLAQTLSSGKSITQGQINGLVGSVAQIGSANGGKRINSATASLIAQSIGLTTTVASGKKVTPGQVSALVTSSINSALSAGSPKNRTNGGGSGVGALAGGLSAIAAVTIGAVATGTPVNVKTIGNLAVNSISSIPGLAPWGAVIRNASAVAMNNISKPTAAASTVASLAAGPLSKTVNSGVSTISAESTAITQNIEKTKKVPLSALATSGLSPSAAASLTASVNAMNVGGSSPVKLPTVATGTVDRSQLTSQINSILGSNKIQVPNFSGIPPIPNKINTDSASLAEQDSVIKEIATLKDKRWDVSKAAGNARYKASEAKQKLPQGDPEIAALERASVSAQKELDDLDKKIVELQRKQYTLITGEPYPEPATG